MPARRSQVSNFRAKGEIVRTGFKVLYIFSWNINWILSFVDIVEISIGDWPYLKDIMETGRDRPHPSPNWPSWTSCIGLNCSQLVFLNKLYLDTLCTILTVAFGLVLAWAWTCRGEGGRLRGAKCQICTETSQGWRGAYLQNVTMWFDLLWYCKYVKRKDINGIQIYVSSSQWQ